jgi:hypothetical protein
MHQIHPTVGQWYLRPKTGKKFEVIDIDDGDGMIEIQDEEGTLDQVESDAWFTDGLEATDQPQDFSGALDSSAESDEAGDPAEISMLNTDPLRVAQDEMVNNSETSDTAESPDASNFDEGDEQ